MVTVYILHNDAFQTYVGCSENFATRFQEHNNPLGKKRWWTRLRWPWHLLHKEEFDNLSAWLKREKEFKTWKWRDYIRQLLINRE